MTGTMFNSENVSRVVDSLVKLATGLVIFWLAWISGEVSRLNNELLVMKTEMKHLATEHELHEKTGEIWTAVNRHTYELKNKRER